MDEQAAAVDMPQEVVAEACALAGALDDAGDIGQHKALPLADVHDAEVGEQRGEVVVRYLGMGVGHHAQKRALAHVGEAHQAHVGQQLELQQHGVRLAGQAGLGEAGRLARGGGEALVAPAAAAAAAGDKVLAGAHVVHDGAGVRVADDGADGDAQDNALTVPARAALAAAGGAVPGRELALVAEVHERVHVGVNAEDNVAAAAAITAVRPAGRDVFLAVEADCPVAALAGADIYGYLVNKG